MRAWISKWRRENRFGASSTQDILQKSTDGRVSQKLRRGSISLGDNQPHAVGRKESQAAIKIGEQETRSIQNRSRSSAIRHAERQVAHCGRAMKKLLTDGIGRRTSSALVALAHQISHRALMERQAAKGDDQQEHCERQDGDAKQLQRQTPPAQARAGLEAKHG